MSEEPPATHSAASEAAETQLGTATQNVRPRNWSRMFDGWQAALVLVGSALLTAVVVVPRPAEPIDLPQPRVDWVQLSREERKDQERVARAQQRALPYEVRAVGEALRVVGLAENAGDAETLRVAHADADVALKGWVAKFGAEELLELRAVQAERFAAAVRAWEKDRAQSQELLELGGKFLRTVEEQGWLGANGAFVGNDQVLRLLFRFRFGTVLRLDKHPFAPTLNESRLLARFRFRHLGRAPGPPDMTELQRKLFIVSALSRVDSTYPLEIATGVVSYRLGNFQEAADLFDAHRTKHPTGPWSLLVHNYKAAAAHALQY